MSKGEGSEFVIQSKFLASAGVISYDDSSAIGQQAVFCMYQNFDRINVKFSTFGDWYYVSTVNTATF